MHSSPALLPEPEHIDVSGIRIAYRQLGDGVPALLLHGFFGDSRVWRRQFELADDYKLIAWDAPGCGGSSLPPQTYRMGDYAECLAEFIDALGLEQPHLVGNSFGGALALALADLHGSRARSLTLIGAYAGWSGSLPADSAAARLANGLADLGRPPDLVVKKWLPGFVTSSAPQPLVDELTAIIAGFNPDGMRPMILALAEADLRQALPRIELPTLLVWGDQDVRSPLPIANELQRQISQSKLVVLSGAGHLTQMEAADRLNSELRAFLVAQDRPQTL